MFNHNVQNSLHIMKLFQESQAHLEVVLRMLISTELIWTLANLPGMAKFISIHVQNNVFAVINKLLATN